MTERRRVAVFGGSFDPIHIGHLRSAVELCECLQLDELRLLPARISPLKEAPGADPEQRLAMTRLAVADEPGVVVDARELHRQGPSYTVDTLAELRAEEGAETSLSFVLGSDAFASLERWRDWQRLAELAHLVVLQRPGAALEALSGELADWYRSRRLERAAQLSARPAGGILPLTLTQLPVAATAIRELIADGRSPRYLIPDTVWNYIRQHGLYGPTTSGNR